MSASLSAYLNLLRFAAALAVYLSHAQYFTKFRIPYVGNVGNEAVFVFFVLSGMLITFSGIRQPDGGAFMKARLIRLWSVALPALALTLVADTIGQSISLAAYAPMQPYNVIKWVGSIGVNALFLNQIWNLNVFPGTNGPFWSLSYEFWYYALFAAAFYFSGRKRIILLAGLLLLTGPAILIAFPIWLMGSALYVVIARRRGSAIVGWACWTGSLAGAAAFGALELGSMLAQMFPAAAAGAKWKVDFWPESYLIGALVALNIYGFALIGDRFQPLLRAAAGFIRTGADSSFGLYLFHYPLMYLVKAMLVGAGLTGGAGFVVIVYAVPFAIAVPLALLCEKHKDVTGKAVDFALASLASLRRKPTRQRGTLPTNDPLYDATGQRLFDEQA